MHRTCPVSPNHAEAGRTQVPDGCNARYRSCCQISGDQDRRGWGVNLAKDHGEFCLANVLAKPVTETVSVRRPFPVLREVQFSGKVQKRMPSAIRPLYLVVLLPPLTCYRVGLVPRQGPIHSSLVTVSPIPRRAAGMSGRGRGGRG
jgi:hypothetical protein